MPVRTSLLLPALLPLVLTASLHANPLKVKTAQGKVQGTSVAEGKVRAFKGIPYAAPPTGNLRWQPPQPPQHFNGTFVASDYGHRCVQTNAFEDMVFHDPGPSEDCLTLNIWAPASGKKLPVMVWIYGGGYSAGATSEARQDGQFLAQRNAIVVTPQLSPRNLWLLHPPAAHSRVSPPCLRQLRPARPGRSARLGETKHP